MADVEKLRYNCYPKLQWWIIATVTLFLLPRDCSSDSCQWIVDDCKKVNGRCMVFLKWARIDGSFGCPHRRDPKSAPAKVTDPCFTGTCELMWKWCPWGAWEKPSATCGYSAGSRTRWRIECCHPVTNKKHFNRRIICPRQKNEKMVDYVSCVSYTQYYYGAAIALSMISFILIIVCYIIRSRRISNMRSRQQSALQTVVFSPAPTPAVILTPGDGNTPADEGTQPPTYGEVAQAHENSSFEASGEQLPNYDNAVSQAKDP